MSVRVLLADDEGLIRAALAALLPLEGDIEIVAQASTGRESVEQCVLARPDVAVLDVEMPDLNGLDAARAITQRLPGQVIVLLTRHARPGMLRSALLLGVRGFVGKDTEPAGIAAAIMESAAGGRPIDPVIAAEALIGDCPLTEREKDVLRVAGEGYNVQEIARSLHLAPGTVRNYLSSSIHKTHTQTRHQAAREARQRGWL